MYPMYKFRVGPTALTANGQNLTSLEGQSGRFIDSPRARVRVKMTSSVAAQIEASFAVGQLEATQRSIVPVEGAAGRGPDNDIPWFADAYGFQSQECFIRIYEIAGGTPSFTYDFEQVPF